MKRFARPSDEAVDRLLDGSQIDPEFDDIAPLVARLRERGTPLVDEAIVALHVWGATATAGSMEAAPSGLSLSLRPSNSTGNKPFLRRRGVVAVVSAVLLIASATGVAAAANGAKPGDSFYSVDRAFEAIGINDGGGTERVEEIRALFDAGQIAPGLSQTAEVIPDIAHEGSPEAAAEAAAALEAAAQSVESASSEASEQTRQAVGALLRYLSNHVGHVDAAVLIALARTIGNPDPAAANVPTDPPTDAPGSPPSRPAPPVDVPQGPPDDAPAGPPQP